MTKEEKEKKLENGQYSNCMICEGIIFDDKLEICEDCENLSKILHKINKH